MGDFQVGDSNCEKGITTTAEFGNGFGGGVAAAFACFPYVFECYLSGSCGYRSEDHQMEWDNGGLELVITGQDKHGATTVTGTAVALAGAGPTHLRGNCGGVIGFGRSAKV